MIVIVFLNVLIISLSNNFNCQKVLFAFTSIDYTHPILDLVKYIYTYLGSVHYLLEGNFSIN